MGKVRRRTRQDGATGIGETVLDNGLKVLTLERHEVPIATVMIWYRVGSADEPEGGTGLAHFTEHLMFKGTDRYGPGEIDRLTQRLGGTNNAMTSRDYTAYYFSVPAGGVDEVLALEANRMRRCTFDRKELLLERDVVLEEISQSEDSPYGSLDKQMFATAFTAHPYRHPILGWRADMERVDRPAVRAFYDRHYHPANAFVVAVGDFETAALVDSVGAHFGRLGRRRSGRAAPGGPVVEPVTEEEMPGPRRIVVRKDVQVPRIQMLFRSVPASSPDDPALDVLSSLLSDGRSSLLYGELVEKRSLMSSIDTINDTKVRTGLFWVYGKVLPGVDPERAVAAIGKALERLARRGPTRRALEQARNQAEADFYYHTERIHGQATLIGRTELGPGWRQLGRSIEQIRATTAEDIQRLVAGLLVEDRMTLGVLLPERSNGRRA